MTVVLKGTVGGDSVKTRNCVLLSILFPVACWAQAINFTDYFEDKTMRVDYFHTVNAEQEDISIDQIYVRGVWAGNPETLLPAVANGKYTVTVIDVASNRRIYSRHLLNIVFEYKGTKEAQAGHKKTFHQTVLLPCPKQSALLVIERRDRQHIQHAVFRQVIDPNDVSIHREMANRGDQPFALLENGPAQHKVDLVFVAEGYEAGDLSKFKTDTQRFVDYLFTVAPFDQLMHRFNVRAVFRASAETGVDMPTKGIYKNTVLSASYNTLGMPRYCTVFDNKTMRDIADRVPYDFLIVLVNTPRYGGAGFYNDYCVFTSDDKRSEEIFTHEFGHSFAGLADEYISEDYFSIYYKRGIEPLEPNITACLNAQRIKWGHLLTAGLPIPTPAKPEYDKQVGLFEGAGYTKTGMYRACLHCVMGAGGVEFCTACREAIKDVITEYSD